MNGRPLYIRGQDEPVYLPLRMPPMPLLPAVMRNSLNRFNCLSVLWTSLHLVDEGAAHPYLGHSGTGADDALV